MTTLKRLGGWTIELEDAGALRRLLLVQAIWLGLVAAALQLQNALGIERLYVLWYFGFILTVHLLAPSNPSPRWWRSVQVVVILGFFGLCYFVVTRAVEILTV